MKIARFMYEKEFHYGKVEPGEGTITKLGGEIFGDYYLTEKTFSLSEVFLLPPVAPPNIIAIGLNYRQHAKESGHSLPDHPVIFLKATTSLTGPGTRIKLPLEAPEEVDYEAELAVVIGKKAKNISRKEVSEYVLGYTCANDVSARDCQKRYDKQWARAKSFDTFCPLGPWIETEVNPEDLRVKSILNGQVMQDSRTSDMIFNPEELVSYCSQNMTLLPGTVILTGTPEGVGLGRDPHVYLESGDEIKIDIEGIGVLENTVDREKKKEAGRKVIETWSDIVGTIQLTPSMFAKIKSFIEDGMEEELIVEVMKYSQNQVSGNPFNYIVSILNDYVNQGILTVDEYNKLIARGEEHGGQVQRNNRTKKAGTQKPDLEELYKQGYR